MIRLLSRDPAHWISYWHHHNAMRCKYEKKGLISHCVREDRRVCKAARTALLYYVCTCTRRQMQCRNAVIYLSLPCWYVCDVPSPCITELWDNNICNRQGPISSSAIPLFQFCYTHLQLSFTLCKEFPQIKNYLCVSRRKSTSLSILFEYV